MTTADTSERGLERLICTTLTGHPCDPPTGGGVVDPRPGYGGLGWIGGSPHDYDREYCVDLVQLTAFLCAAQPEAAKSLALDEDGVTRRKFLARLQGEISKRGTIDVLRHGIRHGAHDLSLFYGFLISKLPSPKEEDLSKGILDAIDMDSYRVEKRAMQRIVLADENAEIDPVPTSETGHGPEPELDRLSNIISTFNDLFGDIEWEDGDRVRQLITETIPSRVAVDTAFRSARENSDRENARIEHDRALLRVMTGVMKDDTELFRQFMDNESFKRWMTDTVFAIACEE